MQSTCALLHALPLDTGNLASAMGLLHALLVASVQLYGYFYGLDYVVILCVPMLTSMIYQ
jgi:hypothetical protein